MKTLQNDFTTPDQSKRLLELGVPADSADCYCNNYGNVNAWREEYDVKTYLGGRIPCWSAGRLIEMWEICVGVKFDRWSRNGVLLPLIKDCIEYIEFALNPYTKVEFDFSKLEELC